MSDDSLSYVRRDNDSTRSSLGSSANRGHKVYGQIVQWRKGLWNSSWEKTILAFLGWPKVAGWSSRLAIWIYIYNVDPHPARSLVSSWRIFFRSHVQVVVQGIKWYLPKNETETKISSHVPFKEHWMNLSYTENTWNKSVHILRKCGMHEKSNISANLKTKL